MSNQTPQFDLKNDLDWIAFCYVADELPQEHVVAFEAELESSQKAREAVERAMALCVDVYQSSEPVGVTGGRDSVTDRVVASRYWMAILGSVAAVVLVILSISSWSGSDSPEVASGDSHTEALAVAWADSFPATDDELLFDLITFSEPDLDDSQDNLSEQDGSDEEIDDWMLVAFDLEETLTQ